HLGRVVKIMKRKNIRVILMANYFDSKDAHVVAKKTNSTILSLPESVGGVPEAVDYISLFDFLVSGMYHTLNNS
ncbi:MAG: hypothetical protein ACE5EK_01840, partial [Nitrospinales bacterium]